MVCGDGEKLMDRPDQTTHFGFRDVPLGDKQTLVNDVFHSVASALRPDERSDVGGPAPGLEGHHDQRAQSAEAAMRRSRCSMSPAAPAISHSAPPRRRAPAFAPPSATSIPICSKSAANARTRRGISTTRCRSSRAMPRRWHFPTAASTPTPSPSASATCRGSISR